jgi:hypothetical protein
MPDLGLGLGDAVGGFPAKFDISGLWLRAGLLRPADVLDHTAQKNRSARYSGTQVDLQIGRIVRVSA